MAVSSAEGRAEILEDLAGAVERIELAGAALAEAFELLSEAPGERLEGELFRPVQRALGRGKRTLSDFAQRSGLEPRPLEPPMPGPPSQGVRAFVEVATVAAAEADGRIAALQDSGLPVEFGDPELRSGLSETRAALGSLGSAAREFLRTLGR